MLPGLDGYSLCKHIREAGVNTPVIMLTARGTNMDVVIGLRQGADDYLAKPFDSEVLIARMEALLRRSSSSSPPEAAKEGGRIFRFGEFTLDRHKGELFRDTATGPAAVPLNAQEYRLLEFLAANSGRVIGREEILDAVWGYDSDTTTRTIDVHVAKLRQRLGESDLPRHILTIRGRGYKFIL
jgi:DNA-binding response OmpR family regulator